MELCTKLSITISFTTSWSPHFARLRLNTIHSAHVKRKLPLSLFRVGGGGRRRIERNFQRLIVVVASIAFQLLFLRRKCEAQRFPKGRTKDGRNGKSKPNNDALDKVYFLRGKKWSLGVGWIMKQVLQCRFKISFISIKGVDRHILGRGKNRPSAICAFTTLNPIPIAHREIGNREGRRKGKKRI